jgi:hypothetical protein
MTIFNPSGFLDIASDPSDLGDGDLVRCKNLSLDRTGMAETRDGSSKINESALDQTTIHRIVEQGGTRYTFAGTKIYEDESAIETGLTSAKWSALKYNAYNSSTEAIFALNGTDRKRIEGSNVYEWGIEAPSAAPRLSAGSESGLTGTYKAKITYCRKEGSTVVCESNPSDESNPITIEDGSVFVSWDASSDPQVTHVRIYRTLADGEVFYHDQDIAVGAHIKDSTTADGALGSQVEIDHNRPPAGAVCFGPDFNGYCFIASGNLLYFCKPKQPEYWPADYYVEVGSKQFPIKSMDMFNGQLHVLTARDVFAINGTGFESFFPVGLSCQCGTQGLDGITVIQGHGIFHIGTDGVYLFDSSNDVNITDLRLRPIFRGVTRNGVPGVNTSELDNVWIQIFKGKVYLAYPTGSNTYPDALLVMDLTTQKTSYYDYDQYFSAACVDDTNNRLIVGDTSGYLWQLEDLDETDDDGTANSGSAGRSKASHLPCRPGGIFREWVKYDVGASGAESAAGYLMLDETAHQAHTLPVTG